MSSTISPASNGSSFSCDQHDQAGQKTNHADGDAAYVRPALERHRAQEHQLERRHVAIAQSPYAKVIRARGGHLEAPERNSVGPAALRRRTEAKDVGAVRGLQREP